jgi:cell division protein FtsB
VKRLHYDKKQIVIFMLIVIFIFMLFGLNSRLSDLFRLSDQRDIMQTKVIAMKNTEIALQTQITFATSDLAVEAWARDQGHMAQPGDVIIVPLSPVGITQQADYLPKPTLNGNSNLKIWWDLFFAK